MEFEEIRDHIYLKDRVYQVIKLQIITGKLEPNTHLNEAELSKMMKVSRAPIRESLNLLEKEGFVNIVPRRGAIVSLISKLEVENIWEIRSVLEPYAAENAALNFQEKELQEIENKIRKLLQEPYDLSDYLQADLNLHELLFKDLPNIMLKEIIVSVRQNSLRILNFAEGKHSLYKDVAPKDTQEHLEIIEALKVRDPKRSADAVFRHVMNSKQRIVQVIEKLS
jgi:DNA-binding GntR family transcriptional regulator